MIANIEISTPWMLAVLAGAATTIGTLFRMLIVSKEREYAGLLKEKERDVRELENLWKSFRDISEEAVKITTARENSFRLKEGLEPMPRLAAVVPESFSPSTELGRANAEIATFRAQLAALRISAGQLPTLIPEAGSEKR